MPACPRPTGYRPSGNVPSRLPTCPKIGAAPRKVSYGRRPSTEPTRAHPESKMPLGQAPPGVAWSARLDGFQGDLVPQPLELADELPLVVLGGVASLEVVVAQLLVGHALVQDVVGDHQHRMGHGHGRLARTPATPQAVVLGVQVGALGPAGRLGDLTQTATQPLGGPCGSAPSGACQPTRCSQGTPPPRRPDGPRWGTGPCPGRSRPR